MILDPNVRRDTPVTSLDDTAVWQEITRLARAALREAPAGEPASATLARMRAAMPAGETWDVRAEPLLQATDERPVVVVAIERIVAASAAAAAPSSGPTLTLDPAFDDEVDVVRSRFGLSPRQAEVATLLARRLTDKEIASRLGISRHTARRHVELTLIRLRVHSRAEVAELLAGAA